MVADVDQLRAQLAATTAVLGSMTEGGPLSQLEREVLRHAAGVEPLGDVDALRADIGAGLDPLGDVYCRAVPTAERRSRGQFYTDLRTVKAMIDWALERNPARLVDPGCGSGRFVAAAARERPGLQLVAIDLDPLATLITRANLAVLGGILGKRLTVQVVNDDYLCASLPNVGGITAFVGNPPYVRHHALSQATKAMGAALGRDVGHAFSGLSGLHAYFFMRTAMLATLGDVGAFITSAEWLDVQYGSVVRDLCLNGLGVESLHVREATGAPEFDSALTSALITCFTPGITNDQVRVERVLSGIPFASLGLAGKPTSRARLLKMDRWSPAFVDDVDLPGSAGTLRLGDVFKVSRGAVTGKNSYFMMRREQASFAGIERWTRPAISDAHEIIRAEHGVIRPQALRKVLLDVAPDTDTTAHEPLAGYLRSGEEAGVASGYICSHRRPWWAIRPPPPPPIVATYMSRQAPVFARNPDGALIVNIALGLYPKIALTESELDEITRWLNRHREDFKGHGRTYQGGLEKFEPRELESLHLPASLIGRT